MKGMFSKTLLAASLILALVPEGVAREHMPASNGFVTHDINTGKGSSHSGPMTSLLFPNSDGTTLYCCYARGKRKEKKRWDVGMCQPMSYPESALAETERDEYIAIPSPDESMLLVLCGKEEGYALVVTDMKLNDLAEIADGVDPIQSQFFWGRDGKEVYYTIPAASGRGMSLRVSGVDGKEQRALFGDGISEFDYCSENGRLVARKAGHLLILDAKEETGELNTDSPETREFGLRTFWLSPDGTKLAIGGDNLRILNLKDKNRVIAELQVPSGDNSRYYPTAWLPDGSGILFDKLLHWGSREGAVLSASLRMLTLDGKETEIERPFCAVHPCVNCDKEGGGIRYLQLYLRDAEEYEEMEIPIPSDLKPTYGGEWHASKGPYGGRISDFEVAPSDSDYVYVVINGVFYRTEDGGDTWKAIPIEHMNTPSDIAIDPHDCKKVYGLASGRIMVSNDAGENWKELRPGDMEQRFQVIESHPKESGIIYGLLTDGKTLAKIEIGSMTVLGEMDKEAHYARFSVDYYNPDLISVGESYYLFRFSTDGGKTWKEFKLPNGEQRFVFLSGDPSGEDYIYAEMHSGRVYFSGDGGKTWEMYADPGDEHLWTKAIIEQVEKMFPLQASTKEPGLVEGYNLGQEPLAVADPKNRDRVYMPVHSSGLYRSDDGGKTWKPANKELGLLNIRGLYTASKERLYAFTGGWVASQDGCQSWHFLDIPRTMGAEIMGIHPTIDGLLLLADSRAGIFRSEDGGKTWEVISSPAMHKSPGAAKCFLFDEDDPKHITLYSDSGVMESKDAGKKWELISEFESPEWCRIVVATKEAMYYRFEDNRVFMSKDLGKTWSVLSGPYLAHGVEMILGRPGEPEALYILSALWNAPCSGVIWVTRDCGKTWQVRGIPKGEKPVNSIARNPVDPDMIAVGFQDREGVWLSTDDGKTWKRFGTGLPQLTREQEASMSRMGGWRARKVGQLEFSPDGKRLYALVASAGLHWIDIPEKEK